MGRTIAKRKPHLLWHQGPMHALERPTTLNDERTGFEPAAALPMTDQTHRIRQLRLASVPFDHSGNAHL
jgi:hypothetical protein